MKLVHLGTEYGGWTIDIDRVSAEGVVLDCGVGTDMSFCEALHELRPKLLFVLVDHTDESEEFVTKRMGRPWVTFIKAAVVSVGHGPKLRMYRHRTSGSESSSLGHSFIDPSRWYEVPTVNLRDLVVKHKPCLVKLDIESAEYGAIEECIGVEQVCCEFHHRMDSRFTASDTQNEIANFLRAGYTVADRTPTDEVLLVRT
jgi:FkbM family methyltransferase